LVSAAARVYGAAIWSFQPSQWPPPPAVVRPKGPATKPGGSAVSRRGSANAAPEPWQVTVSPAVVTSGPFPGSLPQDVAVLTTFNRMHRFGNPLKVTPLLKIGRA